MKARLFNSNASFVLNRKESFIKIANRSVYISTLQGLSEKLIKYVINILEKVYKPHISDSTPSRISRDPALINELRGSQRLSSVGELLACDGETFMDRFLCRQLSWHIVQLVTPKHVSDSVMKNKHKCYSQVPRNNLLEFWILPIAGWKNISSL